jgi:hypothetical protein
VRYELDHSGPSGALSNTFLIPDVNREKPIQRVIGCFLPAIYVWSLPLLANLGFAHTCDDYPRCDTLGASVSNFISNIHATGAMAALFFYPSLELWLNAQQARHHLYVYETLGAFQAAFGLFLVCPVTEVERLHCLAVGLFCSAGLARYRIMLRLCSTPRFRRCQALLAGGGLAFLLVFMMVIVTFIDRTFIENNVPYLFYTCESIGLSSMAIFPVFWARDSINEAHFQSALEPACLAVAAP